MKSGVRWGRVIAAAFASEVIVVAILFAIIAAYRFFVSPGRGMAEYQEFGARAGYYVAPAASGLATFLMALWAARKLRTDFILNGTLIGVAAMVLASGFLLTAKPEDRSMYLVSFALRILGGYLGGLAAQHSAASVMRRTA